MHTKYKIRLSTSTQNRANIQVNKNETDNQFSKHFRQKLSSHNTRNGISEETYNTKFSGAAYAPTTPLQFESLVLARFISDWKISQFYLLKRLDSLSFLFTLCLTQFLKARDFGWIHLQHNSYSHHICSLEFVRLKGQKIPREKVMDIHHSNHNGVYVVNRFSPDSSHMFHLRHAIVCKFRKGNHLIKAGM